MYSIDYSDFSYISMEWDISFVGVHHDDRDILTKSFLRHKCIIQHCVFYNADEMTLDVDGNIFEIFQLESLFSSYVKRKVIIDATSMTVAELYLISKHLYKANVRNIEIIYTEPLEYTKSDDHFLLSDSGMGFAGGGIPTLTFPQEDNKQVVFLLGYEGDRFADALEALQVKKSEVNLLFGLPSYKINWEKYSYFANLRVISENQLNDRFIFAGANSSRVVEKKLEKLISYCEIQNLQFILVPIGTKPQAIGALGFVCTSEDGKVSVLWDAPVRKSGRTKGISKITITKDLFGVV
ncbi:hypothetical protein [Rheinheimera nanhaiensis]|uniref:Uncharacterized protein n=1 Tax=Rheinheimera nanhaiensis E407-8 TaxID=562729 RepID=I1E2S7_9GAMM|nr:hypothetical protein [Rheinheimera nanhaiensis]GAB60605.1 hypothetical protein RNAN_3631 [Rheinheimera nanhaiensis E407-8]